MELIRNLLLISRKTPIPKKEAEINSGEASFPDHQTIGVKAANSAMNLCSPTPLPARINKVLSQIVTQKIDKNLKLAIVKKVDESGVSEFQKRNDSDSRDHHKPPNPSRLGAYNIWIKE
jgi:hypothetical protein